MICGGVEEPGFHFSKYRVGPNKLDRASPFSVLVLVAAGLWGGMAVRKLFIAEFCSPSLLQQLHGAEGSQLQSYSAGMGWGESEWG